MGWDDHPELDAQDRLDAEEQFKCAVCGMAADGEHGCKTCPLNPEREDA